MLVEEINKNHKLDCFSCGSLEIDNFLKEKALSDHNRYLSTTLVVVDNDKSVVAYCTLIFHTLRKNEKEFFLNQKQGENQSIPSLLIGQLGVDKDYKGRKIGASLIKKVIDYSLAINKYVHFPVIIVDAKENKLVEYYEEKGFKKFSDDKLRLFLPTAEIFKAQFRAIE